MNTAANWPMDVQARPANRPALTLGAVMPIFELQKSAEIKIQEYGLVWLGLVWYGAVPASHPPSVLVTKGGVSVFENGRWRKLQLQNDSTRNISLL